MAQKQNYPAICTIGPLGLCRHFRTFKCGMTYTPIHCDLTGKDLAGSEWYDECVNHTGCVENKVGHPCPV